MSSSKPLTRRWSFWLIAICVVVGGVSALGDQTSADPDAQARTSGRTEPTPTSSATQRPRPTEPAEKPAKKVAALLFMTDQKDGDSWVASNGKEYRLGLVNAPERAEPCGSEATSFTRRFLRDGFTADAYTTDRYGRSVAEIRNPSGASLNVALAKSGLGDARYLDQFRHENPGLARRLDQALASAARPSCRKAVAAPLVAQPEPKKQSKPKKPGKDCMVGYSPCLPVVADLDCPDIGHPVTVTGDDPYRLDRDGDGTGCD